MPIEHVAGAVKDLIREGKVNTSAFLKQECKRSVAHMQSSLSPQSRANTRSLPLLERRTKGYYQIITPEEKSSLSGASGMANLFGEMPLSYGENCLRTKTPTLQSYITAIRLMTFRGSGIGGSATVVGAGLVTYYCCFDWSSSRTGRIIEGSKKPTEVSRILREKMSYFLL